MIQAGQLKGTSETSQPAGEDFFQLVAGTNKETVLSHVLSSTRTLPFRLAHSNLSELMVNQIQSQ